MSAKQRIDAHKKAWAIGEHAFLTGNALVAAAASPFSSDSHNVAN